MRTWTCLAGLLALLLGLIPCPVSAAPSAYHLSKVVMLTRHGVAAPADDNQLPRITGKAWPQWPVVLKTTSSHEEGCTRRWSLASNHFIGKNGKVTGVEVEEVEWLPNPDGGRPVMKPTGKKEIIEADMVLLAMGFLKPQQPQFPEHVFVAGDAANGASLVVRALAHGRKVAQQIDDYLSKK